MKNIPKYVIVFAVIYVVIIGAGVYGLYWSIDLRAQNIDAKKKNHQQLQDTLKADIFPDPKNKEMMEKNLAELRGLREAVEKKYIESSAAFRATAKRKEIESDPVGPHPNDFKKILSDKRLEIEQYASSKNLALPQNPYWLTMDAYQASLPDQSITGKLSIQMMAIEHLVKLVGESDIKKLKAIKRVFSETPNPRENRSGSALPAELLKGYGGKYLVYPYVIQFTSTLEPMRNLVNRIKSSEIPLIIRYIDANNTKSGIESKSYYQGQNFTLSSGKQKTFVPVLGQEEIEVEIWVDMIEWLFIEPEKKEGEA